MGTQTCPRRMSDFGPWPREEGLDDWSPGHGLVGQKRGCTFCGSMHPDDFMAAIRDGKQVGPTDKGYKAYLNDVLSDEQVATHRNREVKRFVGMGVDEDQAVDIVAKQMEQVPPTGGSIGKFYYQHLSVEQRREFIDLINDGRMNIGYPGRFYRLPFFVTYG